MKKNLRYVAIAFVIFYLLSSPTGAAHTVKKAAGGVATAATRLATFVNALGS